MLSTDVLSERLKQNLVGSRAVPALFGMTNQCHHKMTFSNSHFMTFLNRY